MKITRFLTLGTLLALTNVGISSFGSFPANGYGLHDMGGTDAVNSTELTPIQF